MILFGGISEGKTMNDLWSFDFGKNTVPSVNNALIHFNPHINALSLSSATETWQQNATFHYVKGHSMVVFADKLVIFGGVDEKETVTNKLMVLDAREF